MSTKSHANEPPALPSSSSSPYFHFVAGLGSGTLGAILLQPIDLLKTRVQQSGSQSIRATIRDIAGSPNALAAFWRGTVPSALRTGFGSAIYFTTLNTIRLNTALYMGKTTTTTTTSIAATATPSSAHQPSSSSLLPRLSNSANLVSGAVARAFAGLVLMPLTVIKVRYESNLYAYRSLAAAARDMYRQDRLRGFFVGYGATTVRDAPYAGLYVLLYEQAKGRLSAAFSPEPAVGGPPGNLGRDAEEMKTGMTMTKAMMGGSVSAASINFTSGMLASAACSFITNPFDAVKTRIQLQPVEYPNMFRAAGRMVAEEGVRSLYDGLALRMARKALASALAWTVSRVRDYDDAARRRRPTVNVPDGPGRSGREACLWLEDGPQLRCSAADVFPQLYEELIRRAETTWNDKVGPGIV